MIEIEKKLFEEYIQQHRSKVTKQLFVMIAAFLVLSIIWNLLFLILGLHYSRAKLTPFIICFGILLVFWLANLFLKGPSKLNQYLMLTYCTSLIVVLYFESGYTESWSYFLLIPLLAGIYGEKKLLFYNSIVGLFLLAFLSFKMPDSIYRPDSIDISNRILIYIILSALSLLVLKTLKQIYTSKVETVINANAMQKTVEEVVNSFIVSIEAKDQYTFGHSERVSKYALALAKCLNEYSIEDLKRLRLSGLIHDIGKINIPESILLKAGKLTCDEYQIIKTHTVVGARMMERIEGLQHLKHGVLYHHERWDGTGYPTKRKGTDIPLDARVLAIADAFDAMTSDRSYRREMSIDEAFRRLYDESGTQFDPHLIEVLEMAKFEFKKIHKDSHDPIKEFETLTDFL